MISRTIFLLTFLLSTFCFSNTSALKCYVCGPDENCERNYHEQTVNCGINNPTRFNYQCVKYLIGDAVARGCFLETFCRTQPYCYACDGDYCNGAISTNIMSKLLIFISTIGLLLSR
uniref:CSON011517 protein n=1 Tax=Culicoides sonorensis TaxID=179676 RepID=A0A336MZW5_CULSO